MPDPVIEIFPAERALKIDGVTRPVGARAFDVLAYLHRRAGQVVSKAELLDKVWADLTVEESNLSVQIAALRRILGPRPIATVPGIGYQLNLASGALQPPSESLPLPDKPSLAVLPFANLTGDPGKDYLIDGIVSDLITALSRIPAFFVIAASSTFTLKGQSLNLADLGQRLGVRYILEGGIQQAGDRMRINTQLVEAESGHTLWSNRFDGVASDLFELQDRVAEHVAAALEPNVILAESHRSGAKRVADLGAYDLCLQALPRIYRQTDKGTYRATRELLERAVGLDPGYVYPKALICRLVIGACATRLISFEEAREVLPLADEVLSDPGSGALELAFAGHAVAYVGRQRERGVSVLRRAHELNPNSGLILAHSGWVHDYVGDYETAKAHFVRALRINPLDPQVGMLRAGLGAALVNTGHLAEGLATLERAHADAPESGSTMMELMLAYRRAGQIENARRLCAQLLEKVPYLTISGFLLDVPNRTPEFLAEVEAGLRALGVPE